MLTASSNIKHPRVSRPETVDVAARNLKFSFDSKLPRFWVDDDPFRTHFLNSLSLLFHLGERQFVESMKAVREQVTNPNTRADLSGFMMQESLHSREHEKLNDVLKVQGYPVQEIERQFARLIERQNMRLSKTKAVAGTAAAEHLTALVSRLLLAEPTFRNTIHSDLRALWVWHGLEELEHKAVAFDVYQDISGDYFMRVATLFSMSAKILSYLTHVQYRLLKHDGLANDPVLWAKGLWRMWGPTGLMSSLLPNWLAYLRPNFHPWQADDSALIARIKVELATMQAAPLVSE